MSGTSPQIACPAFIANSVNIRIVGAVLAVAIVLLWAMPIYHLSRRLFSKAPSQSPPPPTHTAVAPPHVIVPPPITRPRFLASELEKRIDAIDEFASHLNGHGLDLYKTAYGLWCAWNTSQNRIGLTEFQARLIDLRQQIDLVDETFEQLQRKWEQFPEITKIASWSNSELREKSYLLVKELERLLRVGSDDPDRLTNNRFSEEWYAAVNNQSNWVHKRKATLLAKRKELEGADVI